MDERQKLMDRLSAAQFAAWEVHIYLDTHPNDTAALEAYTGYKKRYDELMNEFNEKFGAVTAGQTQYTDYWNWLNSPWPWEITDGGEM